MNIININSEYKLTSWQIAFTESVLRSERHCFDSLSSMYHLSKTIPIYLVDRYTFSLVRKGSYHIFNRLDDIENRQKFEREQENVKEDDSRCPETELLGFYVSKGSHGIPEIYLCTESIIKCTKDDEELTYLLAKVIIHELAHAYMDRHEYGERDEFYEWMEEGMANKITLDYFREFYRGKFDYNPIRLSHNSDVSEHLPFKYVYKFMESQPDKYKLGIYLSEFRVNIHFWFQNKDKINQKPKAKAEWLKYIKANIGSIDFDENTFYDITLDVLLEDPYNEMPKDEK